MDGILAVGVEILYCASLNFTGSQINVSVICSMFVRTIDFIGDSAIIRQTQHCAGVIGFQASGKLVRLDRYDGARTRIEIYGWHAGHCVAKARVECCRLGALFEFECCI